LGERRLLLVKILLRDLRLVIDRTIIIYA